RLRRCGTGRTQPGRSKGTYTRTRHATVRVSYGSTSADDRNDCLSRLAKRQEVYRIATTSSLITVTTTIGRVTPCDTGRLQLQGHIVKVGVPAVRAANGHRGAWRTPGRCERRRLPS